MPNTIQTDSLWHADAQIMSMQAHGKKLSEIMCMLTELYEPRQARHQFNFR